MLSDPPHTCKRHPISLEPEEGIIARDASGFNRKYQFQEGLGAAFLRPLPDERLELVIWGYDDLGLRQAARLVPLLTGSGQPDFVIVSKKSRWQGANGALAMGFFDYSWNVSKASFFT